MLPRIDVVRDSINVAPKQYAYHRDARYLLRSTGHKKPYAFNRSDPFQVYREEERPGLGAYHVGDMPVEPGSTEVVPFEWRPSLGRAFSGDDFGYTYDLSLPAPTVTDFDDVVLELNNFGTKMIRRYRPGNPIASAGQFLAELHDLPRLPSVLLRRAGFFQHLGQDYLNVEFGWKPFIADLRKMYIYTQRIDKVLNDLRLGNGVLRKRRHEEVTTDTTDVTSGSISGSVFGPLGPGTLADDPSLEGFYLHGPEFDLFGGSMIGTFKYRYRKVVRKSLRYTGSFRYYVPDIGSPQWDEKARRVLYGADATPSLVWEVLPWSWLVDWFTNVGDIISNLSRSAVDDEVVTDSCVAMHREVLHDVSGTVTWDDYVNHGSGLHVGPGEDEVVYLREEEDKLRQPSNPFAFGSEWTDWSSFTARQLAILAALGITRGH